MIDGAFLAWPLRTEFHLYELVHRPGRAIMSLVAWPTHLVPLFGENYFVFVRHDGPGGLPFYWPPADSYLKSNAFFLDMPLASSFFFPLTFSSLAHLLHVLLFKKDLSIRFFPRICSDFLWPSATCPSCYVMK